MQGSAIGPPIATVHSKIEVNNSCNCCCFPWRRRKQAIDAMTEIVRTDRKVEGLRDNVFHSGKDLDPDIIPPHSSKS